jgi:AbrB family looped-hinge helix DNA binding protein
MAGREKTEELVKLRARGQVTLPNFVREKLRLEEGSLVLLKVVDETVVRFRRGTLR